MYLDDMISVKKRVQLQIVLQMRQFKARNVSVLELNIWSMVNAEMVHLGAKAK